jgi:hypothetical protein
MGVMLLVCVSCEAAFHATWGQFLPENHSLVLAV